MIRASGLVIAALSAALCAPARATDLVPAPLASVRAERCGSLYAALKEVSVQLPSASTDALSALRRLDELAGLVSDAVDAARRRPGKASEGDLKGAKEAHESHRTSLMTALASPELGRFCLGAGRAVDCAMNSYRMCKDHPSFPSRAPAMYGVAGGAGAAAPGSLGWGTAMDATGAFLAARVRLEVTDWFVTGLRDRICVAPADEWLPATCGALQSDSVTGVSAAAIFSSAIRADIEAIPARVANKALGSTCGGDERICKLAASASGTALADLFRAIREGRPPLNVLASFGIGASTPKCSDGELQEEACRVLPRLLAKECARDPRSLGCVLVSTGTLAGLLGDLRSGTNDEYLEEEVEALLTSGLLRSLLLEVYAGVPDASKPLLAKVADAKADAQALRPRALAFVSSANELQARLAELSRSNATALEKASEVTLLCIDLLDAGASLSLEGSGLDASHRVTVVRSAALAAGEMARGLYADGWRRVVTLLSSQAASKLASPKLPASVTRYVPLIVSLAQARTAAEVQSALEAAAAPVGSWRAKRLGTTFSVTSYVGGSFGGEVAFSSPANEEDFAAGLTALLGFEVAFPSCDGQNRTSLLLSVLDLGQVTWTRLGKATSSDTTVASTPETGIIQVVSPGLYVTRSLGNSPFTIGAGASLAPFIRRVTQATPSGDGEELSSAVRLGVFIGVDLTLLPL